MEAQKRPLRQLKELAQKYDAPILCAGDVFDRWNSPPELINWALDYLPFMYAIPGQHDLPTHSYELRHRSAYDTLCKSSRGDSRGIYNLTPEDTHGLYDMYIEAFPWGFPLHPPKQKDDRMKVALVHQYVWVVGSTYPGAPSDSMIRSSMKELRGWDVVVYGDNHKGFLTVKKGVTIFNCGTLQRRKSDEILYTPQLGLLYDDATVEPFPLDTRMDVIQETSPMKEAREDMELDEFFEELGKLQNSELDFEEAMKRVLRERKPSPLVRTVILEAMK